MLVKDKARLDAAEVLRETWAAGIPVDPERIASQFPNMTVTHLPLEPGISGMLQAEPYSVEIFVNSNDTPERRRFTIAHEIGHFYERSSRGLLDFNVIDYRSTEGYDLHEFYADEFAASLLMPIREIRAAVDSGLSIPLIAARFQVSIPAAKMRVERLDA
jgi:Zn-dependent peptidase ImmA (M78 family)